MQFEELEKVIGSRLYALPELETDPDWANELRERLKFEYKYNSQKYNHKNRWWTRVGTIAAVLIIVLLISHPYINPRPEKGSSMASIPYAYAQAAEGAGMRITLGDGLDSLRQIDFQIQGSFPPGRAEAGVIKYNRSLDTPEKAIRLAQSLGINTEATKNDIEDSGGTRTIFEDKDSRLTVSYAQGTWYYEMTKAQPIAVDTPDKDNNSQSVAVQWLRQSDLLPEQAYVITEKKDNDNTELLFRPREGPDGIPLVGFAPQISVTVDARGQVTRANGAWYTEKQILPAQLIDFNTALKALQNGEGVFTGSNTRYAVPGKAIVKGATMAYHLSYGLDFTPYLIPVAVFNGTFIPQGGKEESFTAYVSLLRYEERKNTGSFSLHTELPKVVGNIALIKEKSRDETLSDLPAVARSLGLGEQPGPDGEYTGPAGRLFFTSWDTGWLYRSNTMGQTKQDLNLSDTKILELANKVAEKIPLPGKLGQPILNGVNSDGFKWVLYPLIYDSAPVLANEDFTFVSQLGIQVGRDGEIWSVNCAHPMQTSPNDEELLSPQQAWKNLLNNQAQIHVEGFFGMLPGKHYIADESNITEIKLVYLPRHPELIRNQNYDIKYLFKGIAHMGASEIGFSAYVDAVKLKS